MFSKMGVLKNFTKFRGCRPMAYNFIKKRPVPEPFLNKVVGHRSATLLKKRLWSRCFPVNFAKFLPKPPVAASEKLFFYDQNFSML